MTAIQVMQRQRTPEETYRAYQAFREEIRPIQDAIARLLCAIPTVQMILKDGSLHADPIPWPDGVRKMYGELVHAAARRHGLEINEHNQEVSS